MSHKVEKPFGDAAPFASRPEQSRGRLHAEGESPFRTAFQRDRDRIIHSKAFRRLKHKTQVFVFHEGDYYRTRLTHSLEVAQIARSICRYLGLNEDLAEALALAHDFGHPPFGHAGEEALAHAMAPYGGFDHNVHSLRLLTRLEQRYAAWDGLNLTWEALEGVAKHNGPVSRPDPLLAAYVADHDLELHTYAGPEAQIAALADDIAYNNHDIDDGVRAGLFTLVQLRDVPLVGPQLREVEARYPDLSASRLRHETIRRMIDSMVRDLTDETRRRVAQVNPQSAQDVRDADRAIVGFSEAMLAQVDGLRAFLRDNMYRHPHVLAATENGKRVVSALFNRYMANPATLPDPWRDRCVGRDEPAAARIIADFIAGMTDRFALQEDTRINVKD